MTTLDYSPKKHFATKPLNMKAVKIGMLAPLFFSGWLAYSLIKWTVLGLMLLAR